MQVFTCILSTLMAGSMKDADKVFKALADPSRRKLLDLLCANNGQTLGALCEHLDMKRQSAAQHLEILAEANLIATVWRGREKLHFINPVPIHEVYERWVKKFERQRLGLLHDFKMHLEGESHD
jgi:DNA-binding transcriptional ArsR family regulator